MTATDTARASSRAALPAAAAGTSYNTAEHVAAVYLVGHAAAAATTASAAPCECAGAVDRDWVPDAQSWAACRTW